MDKRQRDLIRAIADYEQEQKWYDERGGTLTGYLTYYAEAIATGHYTVEQVKAIHAADYATLMNKKEAYYSRRSNPKGKS